MMSLWLILGYLLICCFVSYLTLQTSNYSFTLQMQIKSFILALRAVKKLRKNTDFFQVSVPYGYVGKDQG